jgi:hypothetical protein
MKTKHYVNYGPHIINVLAETMEHINGVMFTAYVGVCSVRSHHLLNEEVRRLWIEGVCALIGGGDDNLRAEINSVVELELKAHKS